MLLNRCAPVYGKARETFEEGGGGGDREENSGTNVIWRAMMEDKIASLLGERVRDRDTESCVNSRSWKWAAEAHKHTERGDFESGLYYINLCLQSVEEQDGNHHHRHSVNGGDFSTTATMLPSEEEGQQHQQTQQLPTSEILSLIEKRCLVYMKMRHYEKAISDAQSLIQQQCNHTLAYKCLLGALCKLNQVTSFTENIFFLHSN